MKKRRLRSTALILISAGFDEELTIACMKKLRGSGIGVKLVGLTAGLLNGTRGLAVRPDITMADLETHEGHRLIVFPGSTQSTLALLVDPRVHQLFSATVSAGGRVAILGNAQKAFALAGQLDLLAHSRVIIQGRQDTHVFISQLPYLTD